MNEIDKRLKQIIKEQLIVALPEGIIDTILRNIERSWREMPTRLDNPRSNVRDFASVCEGGELDVNENSAGEGHHSCCHAGHKGVQGPQGVK